MPPRGSGRTARQGRGAQGARGARGARGGRGRGGSRAEATGGPPPPAQDDALSSNLVEIDTPSEPTHDVPAATSQQATAPTDPLSTTVVAQPSSSTRGASRGAKFRPKGVRRSEAEREKIVQEQDAILNQRLAEDARLRARANRARGGRGRGRGRGRGGPISTMAAGPLSLGSGLESASGGYGVASSHRGGGGARSGYGTSDGKTKGGQPNESSYGSAAYDFDDGRINADLLYSRSEVEENNDLSRSMPMGIPRIEHKQEEIAMATAAEIEAREQGGQLEGDSDDELFVENSEARPSNAIKDEDVWEHAAPKSADPVRVKMPDGTIVETMDIGEMAAGEVMHEDKKKKVAKGRRRTVPPDPEDEYLAGVLERNLKVFGPQEDDDETKGQTHPREGKVFLFQFPPILPPLVAKKKDPAPNPVKPEPNDDVVMLDVPQDDPTSVDLTMDDEKEVKEEEGEKEEESKEKAGRKWPENSGYLGKLVVRKSGKVTLDWGGLSMAVEAAIPVSFIRTAVLVDNNDVKPSTDDASQFDGVAYGMGRIEEKFNVAPIFSTPAPWVIDPKDLEPPAEE
ncbi:hypothetical protein GQ53DRAFT_806736 [Thozetella sp. PMI_491]|nr:hypothetical protein GQ53DRAFT_806736 [Thozetella sp. PMI_491]